MAGRLRLGRISVRMAGRPNFRNFQTVQRILTVVDVKTNKIPTEAKLIIKKGEIGPDADELK